MKICSKCGNSFEANPFFFMRDSQKKDGLRPSCKTCDHIKSRAYWKKNKDKINAVRRTSEYKATINKKRRSEINKKYYSSEKGKKQITLWKNNNREYLNESSVQYYKSSIDKRLRKNIRARLKRMLIHSKSYTNILNEYISFSTLELKQKLEMQFSSGMSWENYGQWHIDHKKPLSRFNLENLNELKNACLLCNLQPLWAEDNISKGNRFIG